MDRAAHGLQAAGREQRQDALREGETIEERERDEADPPDSPNRPRRS